MVFLVSYDLKKEGRNYDALYKCLDSIGTTRERIMDSTYLITASHTTLSKDIYDQIRPSLDDNDLLGVFAIGQDFYGDFNTTSLVAHVLYG